MRIYGFIALAIGLILLSSLPTSAYATKSDKGNEWTWATGYAKQLNTYGQPVVTVGVKYVVTPATNWTPTKVEYQVNTWANNDGTGWDASYMFDFTTNYSSEHSTPPIIVGNGTKFFNVKIDKCTFNSGGVDDVVTLEDSGYVQFRN